MSRATSRRTVDGLWVNGQLLWLVLAAFCTAVGASAPDGVVVSGVHGEQAPVPTKTEIAPLDASEVYHRFGVWPGQEAGIVLLVRSTAEEGVAPTDDDNDYTRIVDALAAAATLGDGTTIELLGFFDWTEPFADADWVAGGFGPLAPTGLADITVTAPNRGDAVIQGRGDEPGIYYEGFLYFFGGTYQGWEVSNLELRGFDWTLGFFYDSSGGSTEDFNGLRVINNLIEMPIDVNATVDAGEALQNIGIHLGFGEDQLIADNEIMIPGNSESDTAAGNNASSVALQSNTSGGDAYDGLTLSGNRVRILNAPTIDPGNDIGPPFIVGLWENSGSSSAEIMVVDNDFVNEDPANDSADNLQRAFRFSSQSTVASGKDVTYLGNLAVGAHFGITWLDYSSPISYPDDSAPVQILGNTLLGNAIAVRVRSDDGDARGFLRHNRVADSMVGLLVDQGEADAEDNWWGCNDGLEGSGCAAAALLAGILDADPWLVASLAVDPIEVFDGRPTQVSVDLTWNSDGIDTSGSGTVPDGLETPLSADVAGAFANGLPATVAGVATDTFSVDPAAIPGEYSVFAQVDSEMLETSLWVADVIFADGFESGDTTAW